MPSTRRVQRSRTASPTRSRSPSASRSPAVSQPSPRVNPVLALLAPAVMTSTAAETSRKAAAEERALKRAVEKATAAKIALPTFNIDDAKSFEVELEGQLMRYQLDFLMQCRAQPQDAAIQKMLRARLRTAVHSDDGS
jgi:hypothetical protein